MSARVQATLFDWSGTLNEDRTPIEGTSETIECTRQKIFNAEIRYHCPNSINSADT